jgi:hypothetical protein
VESSYAGQIADMNNGRRIRSKPAISGNHCDKALYNAIQRYLPLKMHLHRIENKGARDACC